MFRILGLALAVGSLLACAPPVVELEKVVLPDGRVLTKGVLIGSNAVVPFEIGTSDLSRTKPAYGENVTALYYSCEPEPFFMKDFDGLRVGSPSNGDQFEFPPPTISRVLNDQGEWVEAQPPYAAHLVEPNVRYEEEARESFGATRPHVVFVSDDVMWVFADGLWQWAWRISDPTTIGEADGVVAASTDSEGNVWYLADALYRSPRDSAQFKRVPVVPEFETWNGPVELAIGPDRVGVLTPSGLFYTPREQPGELKRACDFNNISPTRLLAVGDRFALTGSSDFSVDRERLSSAPRDDCEERFEPMLPASDVALQPIRRNDERFSGLTYVYPNGLFEVHEVAGSFTSTRTQDFEGGKWVCPAHSNRVVALGDTGSWRELLLSGVESVPHGPLGCEIIDATCGSGVVALTCRADGMFSIVVMRPRASGC